jgi:hypothetical protein
LIAILVLSPLFQIKLVFAATTEGNESIELSLTALSFVSAEHGPEFQRNAFILLAPG